MLAELFPALAAVPAWLTSTYWFCLIVGGGMLLVSVLAGHDSSTDADAGAGFDTDMHAGLDTDAHAALGADAHSGEVGAGTAAPADVHHGGVAHGTTGGLSSWFSFRLVVFFLATYGAIGVVLTYLAGTNPGATLAFALVGGAAVGEGVHQLFRAIRRSAGDSAPRPEDYVWKLGRVTIAIVPPDTGEVALSVRRGERYVPAVAGSPFQIGDEVVVVTYRGGIAEVVSRKEFDEQRSR